MTLFKEEKQYQVTKPLKNTNEPKDLHSCISRVSLLDDGKVKEMNDSSKSVK